ncbi:hypothetical protein NQZ68_014747 [Dissostichus eleginoides]|nr:hypothetical protein NQZ68_014747 [Dissostichus eleginoides]
MLREEWLLQCMCTWLIPGWSRATSPRFSVDVTERCPAKSALSAVLKGSRSSSGPDLLSPKSSSRNKTQKGGQKKQATAHGQLLGLT